MSLIQLPYHFIPYSYQKKLLHAIFVDKYKHFCNVWPRRAGKTKLAVNIIAPASQIRVGAYYHLFPQFKQARRNVWEGRGKDGIKLIDHFPPAMIKRINNVEMLIEFKNGSIYRLLGSDQYDSLRGANPLMIIFDEYAQQNPYARDCLLPILIENGGIELLFFTPHGGNHAHDLYQNVINNPDWYTTLYTIEDTKDNEGNFLVDKDEIEEMVKNGTFSREFVDQEFYCSFESALIGAYFSKQLKLAYTNERIIDFAIDTTYPVYTSWDLGYRDATAIWFFQLQPKGIFLIHYYENRGEDLSHYLNYLNDYRVKQSIVYATHYTPHDSNQHQFQTGKTCVELARERGVLFTPLPVTKDKKDLIESSRSKFNRFYFHKTNCKRGIDCLKNYHPKFNEILMVYSEKPEHDWSSHGADAYLGINQAIDLFGINLSSSIEVYKNQVGYSNI